MTVLLLVRHAEPAGEARGRCYGSLDVPLSPAGHAQAAKLAAALGALPLAAVHSSPRTRALDTAAPLAAAAGLAVTMAPALRELDFGELEGRAYDEIAVEQPALFRAWMATPTAVRFPGGESYGDLRRRAIGFLATARATAPHGAVAAVSHGGVVRALVAHVLGVPDERIFRIGQDHAAVTVLRWIDETPVVQLLNAPAAAAAAWVGGGVP